MLIFEHRVASKIIQLWSNIAFLSFDQSLSIYCRGLCLRILLCFPFFLLIFKIFENLAKIKFNNFPNH